MKIEIEYPAFVTDKEQSSVTDMHLLAALDGKRDQRTNLSDFLSPMFEDLGLEGGQVELRANQTEPFLSSVIIYDVPQPMAIQDLNLLIQETTDQLTDGYGESPWVIQEKGQEFDVSVINLSSNHRLPISVSTIQSTSLLKRAIRSPVFSAIEKGNLEKAKKHLDKPTLHSVDKWEATPLMYAIRYGYKELALEMIKLGSNVNHLASKSGATPLSVAAMNGNVEVGKALINYGANIDFAPIDPEGLHSEMTPLMWAASRNFTAFVELLLERGADVNKVNSQNETALMFASKGTPEQVEIFELIIKRKPDLTIKDWRGRTIIDEAKSRSTNSNKHEMKNVISKYYPDVIL